MTNPCADPKSNVAKMLGLGKSRSRGSRMLRYFLGIGIAAAALAAGVSWHSRTASSSLKYETQPVTRGDLVVTVSATGALEPIKEVEVGIEVSGTIMSVDVDYNDEVEVGQVLARLDTSKLEAQSLQSAAALEAARAKLLQAQATVRETEAQMARLKEVREQSGGKMPSQHDFDAQKAVQERAQADEASAKAAVAQAQATLDANKSDLAKAVVHSPINGVVLTRSVEPGQTVAAQFQSPVLFTLAEDLAQMQLLVDVDEADVGLVKKGQEASFTVDAYPDRVFPARITQVRFGSETVDGVVTYKTVLKVDNSDLTLRPGMTATASLIVNKRENVLLAPNAALRFSPPQTQTAEKSGGGSLLSAILPHPPREKAAPRDDSSAKNKDQCVWTVRNGQLVSIAITKGMTDGKVTEIVAGELEPGMELVTEVATLK
ncbi:MAG TPA: efflux RND transporter periplasmic adaptor subunit [Candidatus Hydrogenedentes bacterium]|nr:efflux RND transporter periplasmic adaptor subunit [Candidatus Hydrogenedentota bacterium]